MEPGAWRLKPYIFGGEPKVAICDNNTALITGAEPKAGTGLKMQTVRFFQRYIVRDISLSEIAGSLKSYPPF